MRNFGFLRTVTPSGIGRDFTPELINSLAATKNTKILLEENYCRELYTDEEKALLNHPHISFVNREQILTQSEFVIALRSPELFELAQLTSEQTIFAFFHFETHPERNECLREKGVTALALDRLLDHNGNRLINDTRRTAWNAISEGFRALRKNVGEASWFDQSRKPIVAYQFGAGLFGKECLAAIPKMGLTGYDSELKQRGGNFLVEIMATGSLHTELNYLDTVINSTSFKNGGRPNLLIDASRRRNPWVPLVRPETLSHLPEDCVIVDVSADKYEGNTIKGIEGIPTGNDVQCVFQPDDPAWELKVPAVYQLPLKSRRTVVSNYSWPSHGSVSDKRANMFNYSHQLLPWLSYLAQNGVPFADPTPQTQSWSPLLALYKSSFQYFCNDNGLF